MGITFGLIDKLRDCDVFAAPGCSVLDIGSSNLYQADVEQVQRFLRHFRAADLDADLHTFAERLAAGSHYDPVSGGTNDFFAGELLERCGMQYLSFDIADGYKTRIFDLNSDSLDPKHRGAFDVVLNIGTTEHLINQLNAFDVIHDAVKPGGYIVHQLPVAGFTDHGYFLYTGRMFFDMASFNNYDIADLWYEGPAGDDDVYQSVRSYAHYFPKLKMLPTPEVKVPNCAITIIFRKTGTGPFKPCLETSTSVGNIPSAVKLRYAGGLVAKATKVARGKGLGYLLRRVFGRTE